MKSPENNNITEVILYIPSAEDSINKPTAKYKDITTNHATQVPAGALRISAAANNGVDLGEVSGSRSTKRCA